MSVNVPFAEAKSTLQKWTASYTRCVIDEYFYCEGDAEKSLLNACSGLRVLMGIWEAKMVTDVGGRRAGMGHLLTGGRRGRAGQGREGEENA